CMEMVRQDLSAQYAGQMLGLFWVLGHPLFLLGIYIFIFRFVFKVTVEITAAMPLNYTAYLLAGLVPWLSIQAALGRTTSVLLSSTNLVKQVVFPIEILPFVGVIVSFVPQLIGFLIIAAYTLAVSGVLSWTYTLLPVALLLQVVMMTGIGFFLAAITP